MLKLKMETGYSLTSTLFHLLMAFIEFSLSVLLFGLDVMLAKKGQSCTLRNSFVVNELCFALFFFLLCSCGLVVVHKL